MKASSVIELIAGIILIGLFMLSWLVFKNIKVTDWLALAFGVVDLVYFALTIKQGKKKRRNDRRRDRRRCKIERMVRIS